jgi:thioredoxin reductase
MLAAARSQVASYPTTTFINEKAIRAKREAGGFSVELATGQVLEAARLVLAFGVSDELPDIPGLAEDGEFRCSTALTATPTSSADDDWACLTFHPIRFNKPC